MVYRATVDPGTKTLCDVYYYAPDGKKLRSGREVSEYCKFFIFCFKFVNGIQILQHIFILEVDKHASPYTVDNFTFFKEPIGMDSQQEMLRHAKQRRVMVIEGHILT